MKAPVIKAVLGFRIKSGWAAAVLLTGSMSSPKFHRSFTVQLCDPNQPATRQPYHARMGQLETDPAKIRKRAQIVRRLTNRSIAKIVDDCRENQLKIQRATLVVGSVIDPAKVGNQHIRAHAFEGQLFRTAVENALKQEQIGAFVVIEREAHEKAADRLRKPLSEINRMIKLLGVSAEGPWRAEQKLAALGAWLALSR